MGGAAIAARKIFIGSTLREWLAGEIPADIVMDPIHDNHSIALSSKYVGEGEDEYDDDARFGDDGEIRGDGDLNDPT